MDIAQTDHLKAYGIVFLDLEKNNKVDWLLNYRGGSFLMEYSGFLEQECKIRGIYTEVLTNQMVQQVYSEVDANNMDIVILTLIRRICDSIAKEVADFAMQVIVATAAMTADTGPKPENV